MCLEHRGHRGGRSVGQRGIPIIQPLHTGLYRRGAHCKFGGELNHLTALKANSHGWAEKEFYGGKGSSRRPHWEASVVTKV